MIGQEISAKKGIAEALNSYEKLSRRKKDRVVSFLGNGSEKIPVQSAVERDYKAKHKIGLGKPRTIALSRI